MSSGPFSAWIYKYWRRRCLWGKAGLSEYISSSLEIQIPHDYASPLQPTPAFAQDLPEFWAHTTEVKSKMRHYWTSGPVPFQNSGMLVCSWLRSDLRWSLPSADCWLSSWLKLKKRHLSYFLLFCPLLSQSQQGTLFDSLWFPNNLVAVFFAYLSSA